PAPGADDNASGTSAVLEIARVMKKLNYQPEATIKFVCFASEEIGAPMHGSNIYAENASDLGLDIKLMLNLDMIAYTEQALDSSIVDISWYAEGEYYRDFAKSIAEKYTMLSAKNGWFDGPSDSRSFAEEGFSAIFFTEHEFNPNAHHPTDLVIHCNMDYCAEVTKASCATLIGNMVMPKEVDNFTVTDKGNGSSLVLNWSANNDDDLVGYYVYVGTDSNNYDTVYTTSDTSYILKDLTEGTQYYIGITVYDSDGYQSLMNETTGIPNSIPLAPAGLSETALWHAVEINWLNNLELDLFGYNIYRSTPSLEDTLLQLNTSVLADTFFIDTSPQNGFYHNYYISALDSSFNESLLSQPIVSRCVSLDQGILVIDETSDGDGTIYNPTDEEVDNFYENLFININQETIDLKEIGEIRLADIGAYSTIIWHGNDYFNLDISQTRIDLLKEYLEYGGNFLYTGYVPSKAFEGNVVYLIFLYYSGHGVKAFLSYHRKQEVSTCHNRIADASIPKNSNWKRSSLHNPEAELLRKLPGIWVLNPAC
ncbi:MAG: M20/M25/M40 family metallo-hydrolase, partial [Calditrichia bacterium]|nr:M20/M25/M40 family metallo-hydrolase [Calditrichia bacterium]